MFFKLTHHVGFQTPLLAQIAANQKFFGLTSSLKPEALITWLGLFVSHTKASVLIVDSVSFSSSLCLTILPSSSGTLGNSDSILASGLNPNILRPVSTVNYTGQNDWIGEESMAGMWPKNVLSRCMLGFLLGILVGPGVQMQSLGLLQPSCHHVWCTVWDEADKGKVSRIKKKETGSLKTALNC